MVSVVLIEDDAAYRAMLAEHFNASPVHRLTACFATAEAALATPARWPAQVALVDLDLPGLSGTGAIGRLRVVRPDLHCLALTGREDDAAIFGALGVGAAGYLLKTESPRAILGAVDELMAGGAPLSRPVARRVLESFRTQASPLSQLKLTPRQEEIMRGLWRGCTYHEIAHRLGLSEATVKNHLSRIYARLDVRSRTEAVVKWLGAYPARARSAPVAPGGLAVTAGFAS